MATSSMNPSEFIKRALLVQNLSSLQSSLQMSDDKFRDQLTIHFQKRKLSGGGDVKKVVYPLNPDKDDALIIFEDPEDRESSVLREQVFQGQQLTVSSLPPVFWSIEARINPVYFKIMPIHSADDFASRFQKICNVSVNKHNYGVISCSNPSELECVETEVFSLAVGQTSAMFDDLNFEAAGPNESEDANKQRETLEEMESKARVFDEVHVKERGLGNFEYLSEQSEDPEHFTDMHSTAKSQVITTKARDELKFTHSSWAFKENEVLGNDGTDGFPTRQENSVVLDKYTYQYLKEFEGTALKKIWKENNAKLDIKTGTEEGSLDGVIVAANAKASNETVTKAKDKFIALYQQVYSDITRKTIDGSSVHRKDLEEAAKKTQRQFKTDTLITNIDGSPYLRLILRHGDVEEVARQFRAFAGIKSGRTLRTVKTTDVEDVHKRNEPETASQSTPSSRGTSEHQIPGEKRYVSPSVGRTSSHSSQNPGETSPHFVTNEGMKIVIHQGDILKYSAHAVVSPSDARLENNTGGGVAHALHSAAGPQLRAHCSQVMKHRNYRSLQVAECIVTPGFNLKYLCIIHANGPTFPEHRFFELELHNTFLSCLRKAEEHELPSLTIPLIGSGSIRAPKKVCADALVRALLEFSHESSKSRVVRDVCLVNIDRDSTAAVQQSLQAAFDPSNITSFDARNTSSTGATMGTRSYEPTLPSGLKKPEMTLSSTSALHSNSQHATAMTKDDLGGRKTEKLTLQTQTGQQGFTPSTASGKVTVKSQGLGNTHDDDKPPRPSGAQVHSVAANMQARSADEKSDKCPICLADKMIDEVALEKCRHRFCKSCIEKALKTGYKCPVCQTVCRPPKGNQPKNGTIKSCIESYFRLPGYPNDGTITIRYDIPSGIQTGDHPHPGQRFDGVTRTAYLPDNQEGREVLRLLEKAFDAGLVFTVGRSVTSGLDDIVTWNDIHHKTSRTGGPANYGYPDPDYLRRVKEDLAAKGIV